MKKKRQAVILELIKNNDIETQEELARMLSQEGFTSNDCPGQFTKPGHF